MRSHCRHTSLLTTLCSAGGVGANRANPHASAPAAPSRPSSSVAVIGAGASGLAAARALRDANLHPVVYDQRLAVGGVWNRDATRPPAENPIYDSLRTNLPKQLMQFWDAPFDAELPSYVAHADVQRYLEAYCDRHGLAALLRLRSRVQALSRREGGGWELTVRHSDERVSTELYDAVVVANGHFAVPSVPEIRGRRDFEASGERVVTHSSTYRAPAAYAGRSVMIIGGGPSGTDLALDLASGGASVILSYRGGVAAAPQLGGSGVRLAPAVEELAADGTALFADGSRSEPLDAVLVATGYRYSLPFLEGLFGGEAGEPEGAALDIRNGRATCGETFVAPLYEQLFWAPDASLSFVGLQWKTVPFPLVTAQASLVAAVLSGAVELPPPSERRAAVDADLQAMRAAGVLDLHMMADKQWGYMRRLLDAAAAASPLPRSEYVPRLRLCQLLNEDSARRRKAAPATYRQAEYEVVHDASHPEGGWFRVTHATHPSDSRVP